MTRESTNLSITRAFRCYPQLLNHCPRCGKHSGRVKGERLCGVCAYEMSKRKTRDIQLPEDERREILRAAKKRNANPFFVEDNSVIEDLEKSCDLQ